MDKNWQRLGRITSENLKTFLAINPARIILSDLKNKIRREYVFRKNSQVSTREDKIIFHNQDVKKLSVQSLN